MGLARRQSLRATCYFFFFHLLLTFPIGRCAAADQDLLKLSENDIDVGVIALTLAKEIYPDIDVDSYSTKIDALAEQVRRLARGTDDPDLRVRCLNTVLYRNEQFHASRELSVQRKPENYFLNRVLDTKQGNCFSMPLLYVAVAQRLGWPVYLVHVPDHTFVRYADPAFKQQNIEATSGGGYVPDEKYAVDFLVSAKGRKSGAYLRTLSHRELLGDVVAINAITFGHRGELPKAIAYLKLATRLNPRLVDAWANLANANKMMAKRSNGPEAEKYRESAAQCAKRLEDLGFVHPIDVPQFLATKN